MKIITKIKLKINKYNASLDVYNISNVLNPFFVFCSSFLLIKSIGVELFGYAILINTVLSSLYLFDFGTSNIMVRLSSQYFNGSITYSIYIRKVIKVFFYILIFSFLLFLTILVFEEKLVSERLFSGLGLQNILLVITISSIKWYSNILKAGLIGFQKFNLLGILLLVNSIMINLVLPLLMLFLGLNLTHYFIVFLLLSTIEFVVILLFSLKSFLKYYDFSLINQEKFDFNFKTYIFQSGINSALGIFITQMDKYIVLYAYNIAEFGSYNIMLQIVSFASILASPIRSKLLPAIVSKIDNIDAVKFIYEKASIELAGITLFLSCLLIFNQNLILGLFESKKEVVGSLVKFFPIIVLSGLLGSLSSLSSVLQTAYGNLQLHVRLNIALAILQPLFLFGVIHFFGSEKFLIGVMLVNLLVFFTYNSLTNLKYFDNSYHKKWMNENLKLIMIYFTVILFYYLIRIVFVSQDTFVFLGLFFSIVLFFILYKLNRLDFFNLIIKLNSNKIL